MKEIEIRQHGRGELRRREARVGILLGLIRQKQSLFHQRLTGLWGKIAAGDRRRALASEHRKGQILPFRLLQRFQRALAHRQLKILALSQADLRRRGPPGLGPGQQPCRAVCQGGSSCLIDPKALRTERRPLLVSHDPSWFHNSVNCALPSPAVIPCYGRLQRPGRP